MHELWIERNKPGRKAIDDNLLYVERFIAMHGDLPADKIKRKQVRAYRDLLAKFPRAQPHELDGKTPEEIAAWAEARPDLPKLTPMTVNHKGLGAISTLIDLAITEYDLEGNPCTKSSVARSDPGDQIKRLPFSLADLKRLFLESPVYRNPPKVSAAGCGAAGFWIPLIALFEGARLEEIGQLLIEDVKIEDGIPYFYITVINDDDEDGGPAGSRKRAKGGAVSAREDVEDPGLKAPPAGPSPLDRVWLPGLRRAPSRRRRQAAFPRTDVISRSTDQELEPLVGSLPGYARFGRQREVLPFLPAHLHRCDAIRPHPDRVSSRVGRPCSNRRHRPKLQKEDDRRLWHRLSHRRP